jgi:hypothetical protein
MIGYEKMEDKKIRTIRQEGEKDGRKGFSQILSTDSHGWASMLRGVGAKYFSPRIECPYSEEAVESLPGLKHKCRFDRNGGAVD